jgi:hypothetical protein
MSRMQRRITQRRRMLVLPMLRMVSVSLKERMRSVSVAGADTCRYVTRKNEADAINNAFLSKRSGLARVPA